MQGEGGHLVAFARARPQDRSAGVDQPQVQIASGIANFVLIFGIWIFAYMRGGTMLLTIGAAALAIIERGPPPRLVVTDVMMPRMNGLELARRLKARPETARVPLVMLTAKSSAKDMVDGVNAGARFYLTKPFKVEDLKAKVKKALGS